MDIRIIVYVESNYDSPLTSRSGEGRREDFLMTRGGRRLREVLSEEVWNSLEFLDCPEVRVLPKPKGDVALGMKAHQRTRCAMNYGHPSIMRKSSLERLGAELTELYSGYCKGKL